jgi:hypothetical protein
LYQFFIFFISYSWDIFLSVLIELKIIFLWRAEKAKIIGCDIFVKDIISIDCVVSIL